MWTTVISGFYMSFMIGFAGNGWLHAKILFVVILMAYFFSLGYYRTQFLENKCEKSGKFFRIYNEVPTLLLMVVVGLVIFKPF